MGTTETTEPPQHNSDEAMARAFETERPRLLRLAYTTTGSLAEAEDCVQEAWLRLRGLRDAPGRDPVRNLPAWLTTTVSRLALDALGTARARRERYVGTWLPEPLVGTEDPDPADRVTLDESVSMALLVVLEQLSPAERTAFVLHDVFEVPFTEVADVVGRTPAAVRQLASRARRHVAGAQPRTLATAAEQRELVAAFVTACNEGDLDGLVALLDPDVVMRGDGGGKVVALQHPVHSAREVAAMLISFAAQVPVSLQPASVNGAPGLVERDGDRLLSVVAFTVDGGRITAIDTVRNPDKLAALQPLS